VLQLNVDLQGAVRAEALIDFWGGHVRHGGAAGPLQRQCVDPIPKLETTPAGHGSECYTQQWNAVVDVR